MQGTWLWCGCQAYIWQSSPLGLFRCIKYVEYWSLATLTDMLSIVITVYFTLTHQVSNWSEKWLFLQTHCLLNLKLTQRLPFQSNRLFQVIIFLKCPPSEWLSSQNDRLLNMTVLSKWPSFTESHICQTFSPVQLINSHMDGWLPFGHIGSSAATWWTCNVLNLWSIPGFLKQICFQYILLHEQFGWCHWGYLLLFWYRFGIFDKTRWTDW